MQGGSNGTRSTCPHCGSGEIHATRWTGLVKEVRPVSMGDGPLSMQELLRAIPYAHRRAPRNRQGGCLAEARC